jgi:signal peptidase I
MRTLVWLSAIGGAICLLLYLFVFDVWTVPKNDPQLAASVLPQLMPDDVVLTRKGSEPSYGELARCLSPVNPSTWVVGRVFGVGGDTVQINDMAVVTSNRALTARHACPAVTVVHPATQELVTLVCAVAETGAWEFQYLGSRDMSTGEHSALVERGKLFLVSDNRFMHQDSRDFGQVDATTCQHVVYRLWGERFTDGKRRFTLLW